MAEKESLVDLNFLNVGQIKGVRWQNVTDAEMTALAGLLGAGNKGLAVYNTSQGQPFIWDGAAFDPLKIDIAGGVTFIGMVDASAPVAAQLDDISGYQYVVSVAGTIPATLTIGGRTVNVIGDTNLDGLIVVEAGDFLLFADTGAIGADVDGTQSARAESLYVIARNTEQATEVALGTIRLATAAEVLAGTVADEAVTPFTLQNKLDQQHYVRQYFATVNLVALAPLTVSHGLDLIDKDAFTFNAMKNGSSVLIDVDSVDTNTVTLTSLVPVTGLKVTISGAIAL